MHAITARKTITAITHYHPNRHIKDVSNLSTLASHLGTLLETLWVLRLADFCCRSLRQDVQRQLNIGNAYL